MTRTSTEVCQTALEEIEVLGVGQEMPADYLKRVKLRLETLYAELRNHRGMVVDWTIETVPEHLFMPLVVALGSYSARMFGKPVSEAGKESALSRLYSAIIEDDREDLRPDGQQKRAAFM